MPFAGFKDWDACMNSEKMQKYDTETRKKVCGKLKAKHEKKDTYDTIRKFVTDTFDELLAWVKANITEDEEKAKEIAFAIINSRKKKGKKEDEIRKLLKKSA